MLALGDSELSPLLRDRPAGRRAARALGARRIVDLAEADVDFERTASPWLEKVVTEARESLGGPQVATVTRLRTVPAAPLYSREQPFAAEIIDNQRITGRTASKDVRHVEFSLAGSGLRYEPGDALGIWHENPREIVDDVLTAARASGDENVEFDGETRTLREWLSTSREITRLTKPFLVQHAQLAKDAALAAVLEPGQQDSLRRTLKDLQLVDVLQRHPAPWEPAKLVSALRPLAPRLYSIAQARKRSAKSAPDCRRHRLRIQPPAPPRRRIRSSPDWPAPMPAPRYSSSRMSASGCRPMPRAT